MVKSKTPKVTYFSDEAKCMLMESEQDFEAVFYSGMYLFIRVYVPMSIYEYLSTYTYVLMSMYQCLCIYVYAIISVYPCLCTYVYA